VLPILLYPAILLLMTGLGRNDEARRLGRPSRVAVVDPSGVLEPELRKLPGLFVFLAEPARGAPRALLDRELDLDVAVEPGARAKLAAQEPITIRVLTDETNPESTLAYTRLKEALYDFDRQRVASRLEALHAPAGLMEPTRILEENAASPGLGTRKLLGAFLPYVLMLMMFQGAIQHGIYTTAGEKERRTLLNLLVTPLRRNQIIWGKLLYIFAMGLIATVLNLVSMGLSLAVALAGAPKAEAVASPAQSLGAVAQPGVLLLCFVLLVPLAFLFAGFILFMGIRARNTSEAGTSLMPGLFVIVTLGAMSMAPGIEHLAFVPYVPILNVSLAIRKLFGQQGNALEYAVALVMTSGLSLLVAWAATRKLNQESTIFGPG
jgi:sodium transport system permease protein